MSMTRLMDCDEAQEPLHNREGAAELLHKPETLAKVFWTEEPNRVCSGPGCGKRKSPITPLKRCSGCYWKEYCSPQCQKQDWPNHKAACRERQAMRHKLDAVQRGLWTDIYDWIPRHRQQLFDALMAALHLAEYPLAHEEYVLEVDLQHHPEEHAIRRRFTLKSAERKEWDDYLINDHEKFFSRRYTDRIQFDCEAKAHPGGYGCAYVMVSVSFPGRNGRLSTIYTDVPYRLNYLNAVELAYSPATWREDLARELDRSAGRLKHGSKESEESG